MTNEHQRNADAAELKESKNAITSSPKNSLQSPLETYLREINETKLLSGAEEKQLARAIANGDAPDLVIGYNPGYRASWQTSLGGVPSKLVEVNAKKWSGDHCILPDAVPGVLFTSFHPDEPMDEIKDIAHYAKANWTSGQ